eukprot:g2770.t1
METFDIALLVVGLVGLVTIGVGLFMFSKPQEGSGDGRAIMRGGPRGSGRGGAGGGGAEQEDAGRGGAVTRKQLAKQRKKEEKAARRAAFEQELKRKKEKVSKYEEKQRKKDEEREAKEAEQEKKMREMKEAEERAAEAEFDKWKDMFETEAAGSATADSQREAEDMLPRFIARIKQKKVVVLEDLAADFSLDAQEVLDRVTTLDEAGLITGVLDDRGKYIYLTEDELESMASHVENVGRISVKDLAVQSRDFVDLTEKRIEDEDDDEEEEGEEKGEEGAEGASTASVK